MRTLGEYHNRYAGRRFVIVGKGPTRFRYENLAHVTDPVIFINDAVQFEKHATAAPETFFFAHDECQAVWLTPQLKSTAVLPRQKPDDEPVDPIQQRLFTSVTPAAQNVASLVGYTWRGRFGPTVGELSRDDIVSRDQLCLWGGTIHSAIHFAWLCGADEIAFIGCDGAGKAYDKRIDVRSHGVNLGAFAMLRKRQDAMCEALGLYANYIDTESLHDVIPRRANFVWVGDAPGWLDGILNAFRDHNPNWNVKLWRDVPDTMPDDLREAVDGCWQLCQIADIIYCWVLFRYGGIVMDTDSVTIRSFDPLRQRGLAWTTNHNDQHKRLTNGVMGSVRGSRAFERACDHIAMFNAHRDKTTRIVRCAYGPNMLLDLFGGDGDTDMTILPWHYFYPWQFCDREVAATFWKSDTDERHTMMTGLRARNPGWDMPYAVHLWGIDGSSKREVVKCS